MERKLATIRRIAELRPIVGADAIECAIIDGWQVVVKKSEFNVGDLVVYLEIDSWVPHELAPFLSKGKEPKEYNGIKGERLRTVKLRGQLSQGLVLPVNVLDKYRTYPEGHTRYNTEYEENDVTNFLNIQKWERPLHASLAGIAKGNFPSLVPKTNEERIQNLKSKLEEFKSHSGWELIEKLDGSSCTFYMDDDGVFHVCSRNLDLERDENNAFWKQAVALNIEQKMRDIEMFGCAIQGELVGEGIQGNPYKLTGTEFRVYKMFDTRNQTYCPAEIRLELTAKLGLQHVPFGGFYKLPADVTVEKLLEIAEGKSVLNPEVEREGLVFKSLDDPSVSFKAISNKWLLGGGE